MGDCTALGLTVGIVTTAGEEVFVGVGAGVGMAIVAAPGFGGRGEGGDKEAEEDSATLTENVVVFEDGEVGVREEEDGDGGMEGLRIDFREGVDAGEEEGWGKEEAEEERGVEEEETGEEMGLGDWEGAGLDLMGGASSSEE